MPLLLFVRAGMFVPRSPCHGARPVQSSGSNIALEGSPHNANEHCCVFAVCSFRVGCLHQTNDDPQLSITDGQPADVVTNKAIHIVLIA